MRIVVVHHTNASTDYSLYLADVLKEAAGNNGFEVKNWINTVPAAAQNITGDALIFINTEVTSSFAFYRFYDFTLPSLLKKIQADVLVHLHAIAVKSPIKQVWALHTDLLSATLKKNASEVDVHAQKKIKSLQTVDGTCITYSQKLAELYQPHCKNTIEIPFTSTGIFKTFEWHEKLMIKAQQADNKEYFLSVCDDDNQEAFVDLLKAFSKFKSWQQSNMYLLVLPRYEAFAPGIHHKLTTYKYKEEVRILEGLPERDLVAVVASAYAFVHVPLPDADLLAVTAALQSSIPVLSYMDASVIEYAQESILTAEPGFENLGNAMINMYKNEDLHNGLAAAAKQASEKYDRQQLIIKLWSLLTD